MPTTPIKYSRTVCDGKRGERESGRADSVGWAGEHASGSRSAPAGTPDGVTSTWVLMRRTVALYNTWKMMEGEEVCA